MQKYIFSLERCVDLQSPVYWIVDAATYKKISLNAVQV